MKKYHSHSAKETEKIAYDFTKTLSAGQVVGFLGDLGAGKTTFVRGMGKALDAKDDIASPTFAIMNVYGGNMPLYHFDMYRIETWEDLYSTGFFDYLNGDGILAVEWSENIENALPENTIFVQIENGERSGEREITIWQEGES